MVSGIDMSTFWSKLPIHRLMPLSNLSSHTAMAPPVYHDETSPLATYIPPTATRGLDILVAQWVALSFAIVIVCLRIFTRAFLRRTAGWDDWTIVIALVSYDNDVQRDPLADCHRYLPYRKA